MRSWLIYCAALLVMSASCVPSSAQQGPDDIVLPSLVYLELSYTPKKGPAVGVPQKTQATGFFVSEDGFILTSYHLLEDMVSSEGENVALNATVGGADSPFKYICAIVNSLRPLDLLLLKVRPSTQIKYRPVQLGRADQVGGDAIYTSGFNLTEPFSFEGKVSNRLGPEGVGYLWAITIQAAPGQSGAPVYLKDGTVVGILKGVNNAVAGVGYMVPVEYADALIAHLRMSDIERKISAIESRLGDAEKGDDPVSMRLAKVERSLKDVGAYYNWSADLVGGALIVSYQKVVAGDPQIGNIDYSIVPFVDKENGETIKDSPLARGRSQIVINPDGKGGKALIPDVGKLVHAKMSVTADATRIRALEVDLVPVVGADDKLAPAPAIRVDVAE